MCSCFKWWIIFVVIFVFVSLWNISNCFICYSVLTVKHLHTILLTDCANMMCFLFINLTLTLNLWPEFRRAERLDLPLPSRLPQLFQQDTKAFPRPAERYNLCSVSWGVSGPHQGEICLLDQLISSIPLHTSMTSASSGSRVSQAFSCIQLCC